MSKIIISGFADEISQDLQTQIETVKSLNMRYISFRSANGKGIADYTLEEFKNKILNPLKENGISISSMASPIGKVNIKDEEGFEKQKIQLDRICKMAKLAKCKYIRMFSFFIDQAENYDDYQYEVLRKVVEFVKIAEKNDVILVHENEKDIYGDIARRCRFLFDNINSKHFKGAFDFANFVQCQEDTLKCYEMLKDEIEYIHIKDALYSNLENVVCGSGDGKIKEILNKFLNENNYSGFLTLEPHLVRFDSLKSLETKDTENIIKEDKAKDGVEAFKMQYNALVRILKEITAN